MQELVPKSSFLDRNLPLKVQHVELSYMRSNKELLRPTVYRSNLLIITKEVYFSYQRNIYNQVSLAGQVALSVRYQIATYTIQGLYKSETTKMVSERQSSRIVLYLIHSLIIQWQTQQQLCFTQRFCVKISCLRLRKFLHFQSKLLLNKSHDDV